jgi:hypothetical protein
LINVPPPKASSAKLFIRLINISIIQ